jgi:hypothetical protein
VAKSSGDTSQCDALVSQINAKLPKAAPSMAKQVAAERDEGAKLCNSGKADEGLVKLNDALANVSKGG